MSSPVIRIIHSFSSKPRCELEPSMYCPEGKLFIIPHEDSMLEHGRSLYQAEKEKADWIRRYENVIQGLKYWREKALDK